MTSTKLFRLSRLHVPPRGLSAFVILVALALAWAGASIAGAQEDTGLRVSVVASPANPEVNEATTLTATIANAPEGETPSYQWEIDLGNFWFSHGTRSSLSYLTKKPETLGFRVTVSYPGGVSATSDTINVTWSEAAPTPTPTPTS